MGHLMVGVIVRTLSMYLLRACHIGRSICSGYGSRWIDLLLHWRLDGMALRERIQQRYTDLLLIYLVDFHGRHLGLWRSTHRSLHHLEQSKQVGMHRWSSCWFCCRNHRMACYYKHDKQWRYQRYGRRLLFLSVYR